MTVTAVNNGQIVPCRGNGQFVGNVLASMILQLLVHRKKLRIRLLRLCRRSLITKNLCKINEKSARLISRE